MAKKTKFLRSNRNPVLVEEKDLQIYNYLLF